MRLLERLELHRDVGIVVELAVKGQRPAGQCLAQDLKRFEIDLLPVCRIDPVIRGFDRRDAAPDTELEASLAELVEHADLLHQAQRVVEGKRIDQGTETQFLCARWATAARNTLGEAARPSGVA